MTTVLVTATPAETILQVRDRLRANREHDEDLAGVIVLGDNGQLLDDVTMTELFLADLEVTVDSLIGPPWPVTVLPSAGLDEITERLVESRHSSVVVVDEDWPHFLLTHDFLFLVVALIGTTITPYMQFYVAAAVADRGSRAQCQQDLPAGAAVPWPVHRPGLHRRGHRPGPRQPDPAPGRGAGTERDHHADPAHVCAHPRQSRQRAWRRPERPGLQDGGHHQRRRHLGPVADGPRADRLARLRHLLTPLAPPGRGRPISAPERRSGGPRRT
jgi:hypothetical protein